MEIKSVNYQDGLGVLHPSRKEKIVNIWGWLDIYGDNNDVDHPFIFSVRYNSGSQWFTVSNINHINPNISSYSNDK